MECQRRAKSLVVLTLLQLCRAELKDVQPQWYSANIINDAFQPKSISELFSTEAQAPFSTANPIIVSSKTNNDDILLLSTLAPPTSLSSTTTSGFDKTSTTSFPSSSQSSLSSFSLTTDPQSSLPQYSSSQLSPFQQYKLNMNQPSFQQMNQPAVEFHQQTLPSDFEQIQPIQPIPKMVSELQSQPQRNVQIQQEQSISTETMPPSPPVIKLTTFYQPPPTETTLPRDLRYEFPQDTQTSIGPESSTLRPPQTIPPQSNYFLIYQQAPQSIQSYPNPSSSPRITVGEESFTTTGAPPVTSTLSSTFSSPTPTFSTMRSLPVTIRTSPLFYSTTRSPVTQQLLSSTSPTVTSLSTIGSSSSMGSSLSDTRLINCMIPKTTTPLPRFTIPGKPVPIPIDTLFPLKIRVLAPSGSITNVNFNPTAKITTTRKPISRRTPKPRKNTYERCLQGCRKNGQTLCAAPLSQFPVDPKTLRGFPSVCHMACYNSYRKDPYEKIIDGSCSKLRTRIRPIDSDSKLKRDELQKAQYFLDNSEHAVLEFTGAYA